MVPGALDSMYCSVRSRARSRESYLVYSVYYNHNANLIYLDRNRSNQDPKKQVLIRIESGSSANASLEHQ